MNTKILHTDVQDFIIKKSDNQTDINTIILSKSPFEGITSQELAQQILGRRKAKTKLPAWYSKKGIYYPPTLNLEQTSSEITALYKSLLVQGDTLIDLTGGFGIDDYYFSKKIGTVIHCELNNELSTIAAHNFGILDSKNIDTKQGDGLTILENQNSVDWIYIDPSRRNDQKGKVFFLEDCIPNVPVHLASFFGKTNQILIKTSPLLDIHSGCKVLRNIKEIHVVAVQNEVKELLWILDKNLNNDDIRIHTINILKEKSQEFSFMRNQEPNESLSLGMPKKYLYEPNSAILKSGGFLSISKAYKLEKLHAHSHLYTSDSFIDFPGRSFEIITTYPYQKKTIASLGINKANITTRNFPETVAVLRKKLKIKDGGDVYLFFTTNSANKKIVLHCQKINPKVTN
ncbi:THUMP-like domain-containing protein [Aquimarina pacifica]|uniref:THUMP-like domain-containing protein n=1 Tax=Aquimarina pacifica TaxID=1296415 RepID=UPI0004710079|nr:hypothetical protein [Aquimarina pacifica]